MLFSIVVISSDGCSSCVVLYYSTLLSWNGRTSVYISSIFYVFATKRVGKHNYFEYYDDIVPSDDVYNDWASPRGIINHSSTMGNIY